MAYRILPVSDLPNVDFPTIQVIGRPARAPTPRPWPRRWRCRSRSSSPRSPASPRSTRPACPGSTSITVQFDLARNIDAAAQDVQAMIAKAARQLPPQMPAPPSLAEGQPGRSAGADPGHGLADAADVGRRRVRADHRAADLDGQRRRPGRFRRLTRSTRSGSTSIRVSWRRAASASTKWPRRSASANANIADRHDVRLRQDLHRSGRRPAARGRWLRADHHRLSRGPSGPPRAGRARLRRRRERQDGRLELSTATGR